MTGPVAEAERTQSKYMDLRPIEAEQRFYSASDMAILWLGLVINITSFYIAGTLVEDGMSWWQGIITIFTANLILLAVLILSAHPGTRYGIPFPVIVRSSFGIRGAHFATLIRALVACGWYGIDTWIGGQALFICLPSSVKHSSFSSTLSWLGTSPSEFTCFIVFWVAQLAILCKGMAGIYYLEKYCTPILVLLTISLFFWAYFKAGGLGTMLSLPSRLSMSEFWSLFFPSITACIGTWATLALNIPDFSRYARNQKDQILGQMGLPLFSTAFAFIGLAVASSSGVIFGHVISNPITLLGEIEGIVAKILILVGILLAVLTTNIPANIVAPANALVNLSPTHFTFWRGALLTAVLSFFFLPWMIFQSTDNFVYTWLVGYSAILGPMLGIILVDYYLLQSMTLDIDALYSTSTLGRYYYCRGWNVGAIVALVIAIIPAIPGFLHKVKILKECADVFIIVYNNAWLIGLFSGGIIYWFLNPKIASEAFEPLLHSTVE